MWTLHHHGGPDVFVLLWISMYMISNSLQDRFRLCNLLKFTRVVQSWKPYLLHAHILFCWCGSRKIHALAIKLHAWSSCQRPPPPEPLHQRTWQPWKPIQSTPLAHLRMRLHCFPFAIIYLIMLAITYPKDNFDPFSILLATETCCWLGKLWNAWGHQQQ